MLVIVLKRYKNRSEYTRNIVTLVTGTALAQAIPIAITPILTRVYTPADFGVYALFISIVSMVSVFVTGRYELAILLPKNDKDALNLLKLSCLISTIVSCFCFVVVVLFNEDIASLFGNSDISMWLYFAPFTIFLSGIYQSVTLWLNRKKEYKCLAINRISQSAAAASSNLAFGFLKMGSMGLILGQVIGQMIATYSALLALWRKERGLLRKTNLLALYALLKRYRKFPKVDVPSALLNVSSHQVIHVLFNSLFNATIAGYFYLAQRILAIPVSVLSSAVSSVFQEQASKDYKMYPGGAKKIYIRTFNQLFVMSFLPALIGFFYAEEVFVFVFGGEWRHAGIYAEILTPMLFLQFISSPLSFMFYIGERQELNLYNQGLLLTWVFFSFLFSSDPEQVIQLLSLSFSVFYLIQLTLSSKIAGLF